MKGNTRAYRQLADAVIKNAIADYEDLLKGAAPFGEKSFPALESFFRSKVFELYCALIDVHPSWIRAYIEGLKKEYKK